MAKIRQVTSRMLNSILAITGYRLSEKVNYLIVSGKLSNTVVDTLPIREECHEFINETFEREELRILIEDLLYEYSEKL